MKVELTDRFLRGLKPPAEGRVEVSDAKRAGLIFRLSQSGRATWVFEKRVKGGRKRKHGLGRYPDVGLSAARAEAAALAVEADRGVDRVAERLEALRAAEVADAARVTVAEALDRYEDLHLRPNLRTAAERRRQLDAALDLHMRSSVRSLTRRDLQAVLDAKAAEGRLVAANRIGAALSAFTAWLAARGYIEEDIGRSLPKAVREQPRDVVLSIEEVRAIWTACEDMGPLWRPLFRMLIATAQRRGDIAGLRWSEVEASRLHVSASRTKNRRPHVVHLNELAKAALAERPQDGELVFSTTGTSPPSGFGKAKARLDAILGGGFRAWRLHDLRTAFASHMADMGEAEGVVDRVLNHAASASNASAVARSYQRSELLPQRARCLDRWGDLVAGRTPAVIEIFRAERQ